MNVVSLLLAPLISFFSKQVFAKFFYLTAIFAVLAIVIPMAITQLTPFIGTTSLSSAFSGIDPGIWYFFDMVDLGYGLPLMISALVARFLIRRLPVIG
ncbi:hypothetical protein GALL_70940 [mine drainage metagenome]|uniref:DUF2523 domain-containing protein n=1 Tax=mine drainage metagenome TaxID=410659 RepID=A0A1J5TFY4_9ZZZZ